MAAAAHEPTDETRKRIELLAGLGLTQDEIGLVEGMSDKTLRKYYAEEIARGAVKVNALMGQALFRSGIGGNIAAQIFWMKTRARWRETNNLEITWDFSKLSKEELEVLAQLQSKASPDRGNQG